jgi:hypothetical protein
MRGRIRRKTDNRRYVKNQQSVPIAGRFFYFCRIPKFLSLHLEKIPKNFHKTSIFRKKILKVNRTIYFYI